MLVLAYLSSIFIIPLNDILVFIINKYGWFTPFEVDDWLLIFGGICTLIIGTVIAVFSGLLFHGIDAAIEIYDDLKVRHVPKI